VNDIKQKTEQNLITMGGIADCHGIESFLPEERFDEQSSILLLRAETNRQRHAVVYEVTLKPKDVYNINKQLNEGLYKEALLMMKMTAVGIGFPTSSLKSYKKSWLMIPNSKLDPWR
jgi:hypothetical protein